MTTAVEQPAMTRRARFVAWANTAPTPPEDHWMKKIWLRPLATNGYQAFWAAFFLVMWPTALLFAFSWLALVCAPFMLYLSVRILYRLLKGQPAVQFPNAATN